MVSKLLRISVQQVDSYHLQYFPLPTSMSHTPTHSHAPPVVHYHYHYYFDAPPPHSLTTHQQETLRRVRSDHKMPFPYVHSKTESNSSRPSWKRPKRLQLQSTLASPYYYSHGTSHFKQQENLDQTSPNSAFRTTISDFTLHPPCNPEMKERSASSLLPKGTYQSARANVPTGISHNKLDQSEWDTPGTEGSFRKSRFFKKRQIQILSANRLKQLTCRDLPSSPRQQATNYRLSLLEEECNYLRQRFMEHLQWRHAREMQ